MPRALVTGCAGFIGSHLTEALLADGHEVVGVDCFTDNYPATAEARESRAARASTTRSSFVAADLATADLAALLDGCDVVFHLAAEPGVRSSWGSRFDRFVHNNVEATQRLLEAVASRRPSAGSSTRRPPRSTASPSGCRRPRTRRRGRSRPTG